MRRQTNKKMMMKNVMEVKNPMRNLIDQPTLSDQHTGYLHPLSRQILLASEIMVCLGLFLGFRIINPYSVAQYVCSALIMFVSAQVLEGINLSLLSQVMSSRLSRGTYNGALLSTEAGTIARVIADGTITVAGYLGGEKGPQCHLNALSLNLCGIHCRHVSHLQFSLLKSP